jgi:hypothetical protein
LSRYGHGRPGRGLSSPPCNARTWLPSMTAVPQSIRPVAFSLLNTSRCSRSKTPARCQSARRRWAVAGEQPISLGRCRQAMPVNRTKTIALKQMRSSTRGRPPLALDSRAGSIGSTTPQSSSRTCQVEADISTSQIGVMSTRRYSAAPRQGNRRPQRSIKRFGPRGILEAGTAPQSRREMPGTRNSTKSRMHSTALADPRPLGGPGEPLRLAALPVGQRRLHDLKKLSQNLSMK